MASIPEIWPTPGNPSTRVRIFLANIERPITGDIVLSGNLQEAIDAGGKTFLEYRPDLQLDLALQDGLADPELAPFVAQAMPALEQIFFRLYMRKKYQIETPAPMDNPDTPEDESNPEPETSVSMWAKIKSWFGWK